MLLVQERVTKVVRKTRPRLLLAAQPLLPTPTDECTKSVQMFRNILGELNLINLTLATAIYNDNRGAVNWSNTSSTKGMRHVNIRENAVREAIHEFNEVTVSHILGGRISDGSLDGSCQDESN